MNSENKTLRFIIICVAVFCGFLTLGMPLPVLPQQVHGTLGFSYLVVGIVIGIQSLATVLTRYYASIRAESQGAKSTMQRGAWICCLAGCIYLLSVALEGSPVLSLSILILGRLCLGLGESLLITGVLVWGIGILGVKSSGRVMAWNGIAMYGALSVGAPLGVILNRHFHFVAVSVAVILLPLLSLLITLRIPDEKAENPLNERESFINIVKMIWIYGLGLGLGTIGFGGLASFIVPFFSDRNWGHAEMAMLLFGAFYVGVRLLWGDLPDRIGGRKVVIVSLVVEAIGQALLWRASSIEMAFVGVALTGCGFSLIFPSFGVQCVRSVKPENRSAALGGFFAFFDIALGVTGPLAGWIATTWSFPSIYLMGCAAALVGLMIALSLQEKPAPV